MSDFIKSIVFGVIEGVTEWLPVSSTGHLIIAERLISFSNVSDGFYEMYSVVIQLSAVLSVAVLFFDRLRPPKGKKTTDDKGRLYLWKKILTGCIPAAVTGVLFNDYIEKYFFNYKIVAFSLIIYGFLFIISERRKENAEFRFSSAEKIDFGTAVKIGCFQVLSLIPGTSRSGATILGGMQCGASRNAAAEFSFFMTLPIMAGAGAVKLLKFGFGFTADEIILLSAGSAVSFAVSLITIRKLMYFVKTHTFIPFGYYRIILGIAVLMFFTFYK